MSSDRISAGQLDRLLDAAREARVLVVGDVMLDEYVVGTVERTSPEAPVPVLRATGGSTGLGGAANVARQLAAFGAVVELVGVVGSDEAGEEVQRLCARAGVGAAGLVVGPAPTTRKQRIMAGRQQMLRIDREDDDPVPASVEAELLTRAAAGPQWDAVVISDYAKGVVTQGVVDGIVDLASRAGAPVLVDPRPGELAGYAGATLVKANRSETELAIGRASGPDPEVDLVEPARRLMADAALPQLVVTLGERGMVVFDGDDEPVVLVQPARDVFDVSGAGDTVLALLALGAVAGESLVRTADLANRAAGLVVRRAGVTVAEPAELAAELLGGSADKVLVGGELPDRLATWRLQDRRVVFTNGCFDLLHPGHVHLLTEAAARGDVLLVAVNSDRSIRELKGEGRPCTPEAHRVGVLAALDCVDAVVVFDEPDPGSLVDQVRPDVLVKGADYAPEEVVGGDVVRAAGGEVVTVPLLPGWSTTALADRLGRGPEGAR